MHQEASENQDVAERGHPRRLKMRCHWGIATGGVAGTCVLMAETLRFSIFNPRHQAISASSGDGTESDSICKEIDVEDVGTSTSCAKRNRIQRFRY